METTAATCSLMSILPRKSATKCGHQPDMDDKTRVGACTGCPESRDRDVNAAKNMKLVFDAQVAGDTRGKLVGFISPQYYYGPRLMK